MQSETDIAIDQAVKKVKSEIAWYLEGILEQARYGSSYRKMIVQLMDKLAEEAE